jgi:DNA-binding NtrC family response regulator
MVPRVIVFEAVANGEPPLAPTLAAHGCEVSPVTTAQCLADVLASGRHHAVLFAFHPDRSEDLAALRLLRHLEPLLPLIVVAIDSSLEVRRFIQTMRPIYFAARPVDGDELFEAVQSACVPREPRIAEVSPAAIRGAGRPPV